MVNAAVRRRRIYYAITTQKEYKTLRHKRALERSKILNSCGRRRKCSRQLLELLSLGTALTVNNEHFYPELLFPRVLDAFLWLETGCVYFKRT
jgi:hypothetical protein